MLITLSCVFALFLMVWIERTLCGKLAQNGYLLIIRFLFAAYMLFCLYMTLLSRTANDFHPITLVPLSTFMRIFGLPVESWGDLFGLASGTLEGGKPNLQGVGGMIQNIVLFVPFGFLMKGGWTRLRIGRIVALGFLCSLGIEMIQLLCRLGWFDVDDILFNTTGVYLGLRLYGCDLLGYTR